MLVGGKRALVKTNGGTAAGRGFNRQDIESERSLPGAIFADKVAGHARKFSLLLDGHGILRGTEFVLRGRARFHFDEGERLAVVSHEVDLTLQATMLEISRDHNVAVAAQIPVRVRLAAHAGAPRFQTGSRR